MKASNIIGALSDPALDDPRGVERLARFLQRHRRAAD